MISALNDMLHDKLRRVTREDRLEDHQLPCLQFKTPYVSTQLITVVLRYYVAKVGVKHEFVFTICV